MKTFLKGEQQGEAPIHGVASGARCDAIQFDLDDFRDMQSMRPNELHAYMFEHLMTKLVPAQVVVDFDFCEAYAKRTAR